MQIVQVDIHGGYLPATKGESKEQQHLGEILPQGS